MLLLSLLIYFIQYVLGDFCFFNNNKSLLKILKIIPIGKKVKTKIKNIIIGETIKPNKIPSLNHKLLNIRKYEGLKNEINVIIIEQTIKIAKKLL